MLPTLNKKATSASRCCLCFFERQRQESREVGALLKCHVSARTRTASDLSAHQQTRRGLKLLKAQPPSSSRFSSLPAGQKGTRGSHRLQRRLSRTHNSGSQPQSPSANHTFPSLERKYILRRSYLLFSFFKKVI